MSQKMLTLVESLAESLVLWDGDDGTSLVDTLEKIALAASEIGHASVADTVKKAGLSLANRTEAGNEFSLPYFEKFISALQDVYMNGRNPEEISFFKSNDQLSASSTPLPYIDKKILSDFLSRQDSVLEDFESNILNLEKQNNQEGMPSILRLLHTLKGESALLGMAEVERLCHCLEGYFSLTGKNAKIDLLLESKDWLLQYFRFLSERGEAPPSSNSLCERLLYPTQVHPTDQQTCATAETTSSPETVNMDDIPFASWIEIPEGTDGAILADFIAEAKEHLESADLNIMALETDPNSQESMHSMFRAFHSIKGVAAFLEMKGIRTLAHEVETLLDKVRSGKISVSAEMVDIFLESVDAMRKMVFAFQSPKDHGLPPEQAKVWNALLVRVRDAIQKEQIVPAAPIQTSESAPTQRLGEILVQSGTVSQEKLQTTLATQSTMEHPPRLGELLVKEGVASALAVTHALRSQKPVEAAAASAHDRSGVLVKETVKIEAERLDKLLDAIGELVIAESMIVQSHELKGKVSPLMVQRMAQLDKITRGLQQMGTSLRMVPIRPIFQKMTRLVRDLSKKHHKSIEFITNGDDTELDKTVVEKIGDPLVHMVRNAIDHGIESDPALRTASGKPATATVSLSAFQKGGNICIKLEDDGRGLNREAIMAKACESGLIRPDAVLEDREVWQLIFEPGFSTAKEVTETSGRGVGMDVVKRNVQELRGRIDIQSQPGVGTSFSIWLPLTLAIIDGMIVRLGKERFIFPTLSILRIVPLVEEEIHTVIDKGEMLKLQDEMVPLLRLNQIYPGFNSSGWSRLAVIVESDGRKIGIPVDELLGQQQIVIKSLGESFKNIAGLTGGAILSDGMVGMILDVDGLMKYLYQEEARV